jgi:uncharacterized phage-associated protein
MSGQDVQPLPSAKTVAKFLLYLSGRDGITDMDQFKVQKTLYFCQAWSLALRGTPLFVDDIEAWTYGPVVRAVYREYRQWGDDLIPPNAPPAPRDLGEDDQLFIDSIWHDLRHLSGKELKKMTHEPGPWKDTWGDRDPGDTSEEIIRQNLMRDHFRREIRSWRQG